MAQSRFGSRFVAKEFRLAVYADVIYASQSRDAVDNPICENLMKTYDIFRTIH